MKAVVLFGELATDLGADGVFDQAEEAYRSLDRPESGEGVFTP